MERFPCLLRTETQPLDRLTYPMGHARAQRKTRSRIGRQTRRGDSSGLDGLLPSGGMLKSRPHHSIHSTGRSCHRPDPSAAMPPRPPPHPSHRNPLQIPAACCLLLLLALLVPSAAAKSSRRPITDNEIREKKDACYTDIENGLWGWTCRSSATEKENCVLRCLSPECYDLIYGGDPLEEGELDYVRGQEYKYCMHKLSLGESLDGVKGSFSYS